MTLFSKFTWGGVMILFLCFATFWIVLLSSLKSVLVPTITLKTIKRKCKKIKLRSCAIYNWRIGLSILDFTNPLCRNVLIRSWIHNRKTNKKNIRLGVAQWPELIKLFLSCCVPQTYLDVVSFVCFHGVVIIKHYLFDEEKGEKIMK